MDFCKLVNWTIMAYPMPKSSPLLAVRMPIWKHIYKHFLPKPAYASL